MKIICDYCGSIIDENNEICPNCGGTLDGVHRFADEQPRTIAELKEWYIARNLPSEEVTRFFIGKDIREPRAFGIYQDEFGDFVVYKNKSNGERAVRYQGTDEAYAVNELYQKLKGEIADRKSVRLCAVCHIILVTAILHVLLPTGIRCAFVNRLRIQNSVRVL